MKNIYALLLVFTIGSTTGFSQSRNDSITSTNFLGSYRYYQTGVKLDMPMLEFIMKPDKQASIELEHARYLYSSSLVLVGAGGSLFGASLGFYLGTRNYNYVMGGAGVLLMLVSIPVNLKHYKHINKAVEIHNSGASSSSFLEKSELRLGFNQNGLGSYF